MENDESHSEHHNNSDMENNDESLSVEFLEEGEEEENISEQRAVSGPTLLADVWDMPEENTIVVKFNDRGQPVDEKGRVLASFLGIMARNGALTPLNFSDWRTFPKEGKSKLLAFVKVSFISFEWSLGGFTMNDDDASMQICRSC
ncbi:uncharacterized protein [Elaeis guineensis]|uniref:uncharacterized protein isoform X3 n=1 Tax=Elaeis guineensis var. tenera TaxID=51953 RepID=UPI003C6D3BD3